MIGAAVADGAAVIAADGAIEPVTLIAVAIVGGLDGG
jgi:hypothetical protein